MNRKNIAIAIGATGLVAAAFLAGSLLMNTGSSTRVIAGGVTPAAATATAAATDPNPEEQPAESQHTQPDQGSTNQAEEPQGSDNGTEQPQPEEPQPQEEEPEAPQPEPEEEEDDGGVVLVLLPSLKQITPADSTKGVAPAANIVLTFSKEMDKASVKQAFEVAPAVPGAITWDASGKVMTFNPTADFAYGTDVQWTLAKTAKDAQGYALAKSYSGDFKVIRRSTTTLYSQPGADGTVYAPPVNVLGPRAIADGVSFKVGSWQRGFVSFDLSKLPADLTRLEAAVFAINQTGHTPGAYVSTGNLVMKSVTYGFLDAGDWGKPANQFCLLGPCADMQVTLSTNALDGWKTADVLGMVNIDWANRETRNHLSQFRLQFTTENTGSGPDHSATFGSGAAALKPSLKITYLHP